MTVAMMKTYRQNRARFPASDLKPYDGQWVAFTPMGAASSPVAKASGKFPSESAPPTRTSKTLSWRGSNSKPTTSNWAG